MNEIQLLKNKINEMNKPKEEHKEEPKKEPKKKIIKKIKNNELTFTLDEITDGITFDD